MPKSGNDLHAALWAAFLSYLPPESYSSTYIRALASKGREFSAIISSIVKVEKSRKNNHNRKQGKQCQDCSNAVFLPIIPKLHNLFKGSDNRFRLQKIFRFLDTVVY
jgi:hypothetical protein